MIRFIQKHKKILTALAVVIFVSMHVAHAQMQIPGLNLWDSIWDITANLFQIVLTAAAWLLTLTGVVLNVAVFVTTHLGPFINDSAVIFTVWNIIRDLMSIVLIFFILWAAIQMILHLQEPNYAQLLKGIVIMGILINFSFFFARVAIDASNIISLQFYNAIVPSQTEYKTGSSVAEWVSSAYSKGGISDIFMGALSVNQWYQNKGVVTTDLKSDPHAAPIRIILITIGALIVMSITALSFLGAAAACILRTASLVFLIVFSPVWFASKALPGLNEASKIWWNHFKAQLLFLPVYLLGMYVAIRVLSESNLKSLTGSSSILWSTADLGSYISLFVGFAIIIVFLNIPLFAAIKIAGSGSKMTESWFRNTTSWVGRNTFGRAAARFNEADLVRDFYARNPRVGAFTQRQVGKIATSKFSGYDGKKFGKEFTKVRSEKVKQYKKFAESLGAPSRDKVASLVRRDLADRDAQIEAAQRNVEASRNIMVNATTDDYRSLAQEKLEANQKALNKLIEDRDKDAEKLKKAHEGSRKSKVQQFFSTNRSRPAMIVRGLSGGKVFKGANKYNQAIASGISKEQTAKDEILDVLRGEVKEAVKPKEE